MAKKKVAEEPVTQVQEQTKTQESIVVEETICKLLQGTGREGAWDLVNYMCDIGFFEAPASGGNHEFSGGGLARHSLNVCNTALDMAGALYHELTKEQENSIIIVSLLHDLGKCGDYGKKLYIPNILKSGKQSDAKPWKRNPDLLPIDHATRSIKLATLFIDLTEDEEFAIRYHDGLYEHANYDVKGHETELFMILHWSDMWSSRVLEQSEQEEGEQ